MPQIEKQPLTRDEIVAAIREGKRRGRTIKEIAAECGVDPLHIAYLIDRNPELKGRKRKDGIETEQLVEKVEELCEAHTRGEIAKDLGLTYFQVCRIVQRHKLNPLAASDQLTEKMKEAVRLQREGLSKTEIGKRMLCSRQYVQQLLKRADCLTV